MKPTAFEKRVNRRITGRVHDFFAVCPPGLKRVCHKEMIANGFPEQHLFPVPGGIEFNGRLLDAVRANLTLGSPSKILMRVCHFKADTFDRLEKKTAAIDWNLYLPKNCRLKIHVTTRKSRLYHSDAIAQRCEKIILDQLAKTETFQSDSRSDQALFVRADQDAFTLSLDSSGDFLFKRGVKESVGAAPLRENLAFALLSWTRFTRDDVLIDPMCGSGTFSLEAAMIKSRVLPGFFRSFAFESWPGFSPKAFAHMKSQADKQVVQYADKQIFASDLDETALSALTKNISNHAFAKMIDISRADFFSIVPTAICPGKKGVLVLNPPYGKRLGDQKETQAFYAEIERKLVRDFKGWRAGLILPTRENLFSSGLKLQFKPLFHGGLELSAGIGRI